MIFFFKVRYIPFYTILIDHLYDSFWGIWLNESSIFIKTAWQLMCNFFSLFYCTLYKKNYCTNRFVLKLYENIFIPLLYCPILFPILLSYPLLSYLFPILSYPILFSVLLPILSPILSSILSYHLSHPILSFLSFFLFPSYSILSFFLSILSHPILPFLFSFLFLPILSYPFFPPFYFILSYPILTYFLSILHHPSQPYPTSYHLFFPYIPTYPSLHAPIQQSHLTLRIKKTEKKKKLKIAAVKGKYFR